MQAGDRIEMIRLERRGPDANGDPLGDWDAAGGVEILARVQYLRGGEGVMEQRLQGRAPAVFNVSANPATLAVTSAWRVVLLRSLRAFDIQDIEPSDDRRELAVLAVASGTTGGI